MKTFRTYKELQNAMDSGEFLFKPEYGPASFVCSCCGEDKPINTEGKGVTTGYALDNIENFICYECAGKEDERIMRETGKHYGYLVRRDDGYHFTNWPGTLDIEVYSVSHSWHNFAGKNGRRDFWFMFNGKEWHGINIGYGDCATVRALKK